MNPRLLLLTLDPTHPVVVIMCGASGAGKSTLAAHLAATDPTAAVISYDGCREEISGDPHNQDVTPAAVTLAHTRLADRCATGLSTVLDGTHTRRDHRDAARAIAATHGMRTALVVLATPLHTCLDRQHERAHPVPDLVVIYQHQDIVKALPRLHFEGFHTVHIVGHLTG